MDGDPHRRPRYFPARSRARGRPGLIEIRQATDTDAEAVADVYLASFKAALPTVRHGHSDDEIRGHIREHLIAQELCWIATDGDRVVAMMAIKPGWIDQLYVAPDRLGEGIGRRLLELAKERVGTDGLQLWTFQVNDRARRFYESNDFTIAEMTDGSGNEEREPDVRYVWRPS